MIIKVQIECMANIIFYFLIQEKYKFFVHKQLISRICPKEEQNLSMISQGKATLVNKQIIMTEYRLINGYLDR